MLCEERVGLAGAVVESRRSSYELMPQIKHTNPRRGRYLGLREIVSAARIGQQRELCQLDLASSYFFAPAQIPPVHSD